MCSLSSPIRGQQNVWTISHQPSDRHSLSLSFSFQETVAVGGGWVLLGHRNCFTVVWNIRWLLSACRLPRPWDRRSDIGFNNRWSCSLPTVCLKPVYLFLTLIPMSGQQGAQCLLQTYMYHVDSPIGKLNAQLRIYTNVLFLLGLFRTGTSHRWNKTVNKIEMFLPWTVIASGSANAVSSWRKPH